MKQVVKKRNMFLFSIVVAIVAVATLNLRLAMKDGKHPADLTLANIEALAQNESSHRVISDYVNEMTEFTSWEFKTEFSQNGVKIEFKRQCKSYYTYCKYSKGKKCYTELNGLVSTCESWIKK